VTVRVALMNPCYWPEVRRGSERFVRDLADGLIARGHRPRLITSHPGRTTRTVEDGLPITRHWRPPDGRLTRRRYELYLTHVPFSYVDLKLGDDDIAQPLYVTDAQAAARWTARTGRPSVLSYMGIPDHRGLMRLRWRLELTMKAIHGCSAVVALSDGVRDAFWRWLGVEARVIPPGVNLDAFQPSASKTEEPTIFCAAATTDPAKRVELLIEAVRLLRRQRPGARLVLAHPRDELAAIRLAEEHPDVELVDVDDRGALARAYSAAWVTALASTGEAFGLVLVEAMACGTPVVATNTGGMREVVNNPDVGRLFEGERPEDVARALSEALELAEDPSTGDRCRRRAADFSTDRCTEAYLELYGELLGRPVSRRAEPSRA
jgi:glycosyltransferase involved in cell wall biosynthesis